MKRLLVLALLLLVVSSCQPAPVYRATSKEARVENWWDNKASRYGLSIDRTVPTYYGYQVVRDWGRYFWQQHLAPANLNHWTVCKMDMRQAVGACPSGTYPFTKAAVDLIFNCEKPLLDTAMAARPGSTFSIANEPNWGPYATPETYAYAVNLYSAYIKVHDPTARIMAGGILIDEGYAWPGRQWLAWSCEVITRTNASIDVYGINPYAFYRLDEPGLASGHSIEEIETFHALLDQYDPGAPMQILEYGYYRTWPVPLIIDYMNEVNAWLDTHWQALNIERWFWFHGSAACSADYDPCNSGLLFTSPLNSHSSTELGDAYQTRFRVFVTGWSGYQRDLSRSRGSMANPFASKAEALANGSSGAEVYSLDTNAVIDTVPIRQVYVPAVFR